MHVLILDRSLGNSYTFGLAGGLREHEVHVAVAGPVNWPSVGVLPFYRRNSPANNARVAKAAESALGVARAARYARSARPDVLHLQWPAANDIALARVVTTLSHART